MKEEFESRVVAGCLKPVGGQVLEGIQSVRNEIQRPVDLEPSELHAEFQGVTTDGTRQLVLDLIKGRKIAQRKKRAVA